MITLIMVAFSIVLVPLLRPSRQLHALPRLPVTGLDGQPLAPATWDARLVLFDFWSPECTACLAGLPALQKAYRRYGASELSVVGVALSNDDPQRAAAAAALSHVTYPQAWDSTGRLGRMFGGIRVVPTTIVISHDGRVLLRHEGALNGDELRALVQVYGQAPDAGRDPAEAEGPSPSSP